MVPTFLHKRPQRSFSGRFLPSVVVCLLLVGLSLTAMVFIITSRSLSKGNKLSLMILMLPGMKLLERIKT